MVCEMKLANLGILTEYKEERKNITGEREELTQHGIK